MRSTRLGFLAFILSLGGFACGDSDDDSNADGPMCGQFDACGGKLEGSWKLADTCFIVLEQPKLEFCATATAELHARTSEGSITFEDDTFAYNYDLSTEMVLKLPESCLGNGDEKKACDSMGWTLSNGAAVVCMDADGDNDGCECSASLSSRLTQSGEFSIRGNRVQLVGDEFGYCVKGDTLTLRQSQSINMSGSAVTSQLQQSFEKN
jgi:hypothetical protein